MELIIWVLTIPAYFLASIVASARQHNSAGALTAQLDASRQPDNRFEIVQLMERLNKFDDADEPHKPNYIAHGATK